MRMSRRNWIQIAVLLVVSTTAVAVTLVAYVHLPTLLFDAGRYLVTAQLPAAGGLYPRANVTYNGVEVGQVKEIHLTNSGVDAVLSLRSEVKIPSNLRAEVHSMMAAGEQYVALLPRGDAPPLKNGDIIARKDTSVPPPIDTLLDAVNRGLIAIPDDNLKTTIDEAYVAFGGLGPELSRLVTGTTSLTIDANNNLAELTNVIDNAAPVLDTQTSTANSVQAWAAHLANVTNQLQSHDRDLRGVLRNGGPALGEIGALLDRLQVSLPIVLANLVSIDAVAVTYRPNLEQILVLLPRGVEAVQGINLANRNTKQGLRGSYLSFNLNLNFPPPCTTGFLPVQQQRSGAFEDWPDRPAGDIYCRIPQDSPFNVRGVRNTPCETKPGKRAPTAKMCESDEEYVPLNDGLNWKGDPNATYTGSGIPELPPGTPPAAGQTGEPPPAPLAVSQYDPATGTYVGPDGHLYTQSDLARNRPGQQTWQTMLLPPQDH
ncbi:MCE family protein [Mycobacterium vicinigordonae]|uniref:MCE family protein n=1 Tax=Mycobacterium vicinigordonae TaxID=1719132 RepID=A0A7D6DXN8_9MYCO|nr:MlaD family protein [Mycobacterium vicinigordonae]QLL06250.1 MCE family protein [Mycobacterium vicinigordonae]